MTSPHAVPCASFLKRRKCSSPCEECPDVLWPVLASLFLKAVLPLLAVFVLYDFTVCTGITFDRAYTPLDLRELHGDGRIRSYQSARFRPRRFMRSRATTRRSTTSPSNWLHLQSCPPRRSTRGAGNLALMWYRNPATKHPQPSTERLIVIGLSETDMYIPSVNWQYAISYRKADRYAVVWTRPPPRPRLLGNYPGLPRADGQPSPKDGDKEHRHSLFPASVE